MQSQNVPGVKPQTPTAGGGEVGRPSAAPNSGAWTKTPISAWLASVPIAPVFTGVPRGG